jgi:hypothetical protein
MIYSQGLPAGYIVNYKELMPNSSARSLNDILRIGDQLIERVLSITARRRAGRAYNCQWKCNGVGR